jgi:hypothetical protein
MQDYHITKELSNLTTAIYALIESNIRKNNKVQQITIFEKKTQDFFGEAYNRVLIASVVAQICKMLLNNQQTKKSFLHFEKNPPIEKKDYLTSVTFLEGAKKTSQSIAYVDGTYLLISAVNPEDIL